MGPGTKIGEISKTGEVTKDDSTLSASLLKRSGSNITIETNHQIKSDTSIPPPISEIKMETETTFSKAETIPKHELSQRMEEGFGNSTEIKSEVKTEELMPKRLSLTEKNSELKKDLTTEDLILRIPDTTTAKDRECLTANKAPITASPETNKFSAANKEDQIAIFDTFKNNPGFNNKFSTAVKRLDSTLMKDKVYKDVENDFKLAILSLPPGGKTIQNLSMLSKSELQQAILPFIVDTKSKYEGTTEISELPKNKQKLIESIVNGIHDAFPNKTHDKITIKTRDGEDIEVPKTIKVKGIEYTNPVHVGEGGLGHALRYSDPNGKTVIVKQLKFEPSESQESKLGKRNEMITEFKAHLEALGDPPHKNITPLKGIAIGENDSLYMVMEEAKAGGMEKVISNLKENTSISDKTRELVQKHLLKDVMSGVAAMQEKDIKHLDLKGENIFIHEDGTAVLGDFGTARTDNYLNKDGMETTPDFKSPEVYTKGKIISKESDTFSVGMIAYGMFEGNTNRFFDGSVSQFKWYKGLEEFGQNNDNRVYVTGNELKDVYDKKLEPANQKITELKEKIELLENQLSEVAKKYTDIPEEGRVETIIGIINEEQIKLNTVAGEYRKNEESPELKKQYDLAHENFDNVLEKFKDFESVKGNLFSQKSTLKVETAKKDKITESFEQLSQCAKKDKLEPKHEIVNALMHPDPAKRPDPTDVLKHSYFQDTRLESPQMKDLMKELVKKPELQNQELIARLSQEIDQL